MRCHAAEPGAVTGTAGLTSPTLTGVPGGPSAARKGRCQGAEEARLDGPDGRAGLKARPDQGVAKPHPVRFGRTAR